MAKYLAPPKTLDQCTRQDLQGLIHGTEQVFKSDLFGEGENRSLDESFTTIDGKYHWPSNKDFFVYITDLTKTSDIRSASNILYRTVTSAPEYPVHPTTLTPDQLAQLQAEENLRTGKIKQTKLQAQAKVQASIEKKQALAEASKVKAAENAPEKGKETTVKQPTPQATPQVQKAKAILKPPEFKQHIPSAHPSEVVVTPGVILKQPEINRQDMRSPVNPSKSESKKLFSTQTVSDALGNAIKTAIRRQEELTGKADLQKKIRQEEAQATEEEIQESPELSREPFLAQDVFEKQPQTFTQATGESKLPSVPKPKGRFSPQQAFQNLTKTFQAAIIGKAAPKENDNPAQSVPQGAPEEIQKNPGTANIPIQPTQQVQSAWYQQPSNTQNTPNTSQPIKVAKPKKTEEAAGEEGVQPIQEEKPVAYIPTIQPIQSNRPTQPTQDVSILGTSAASQPVPEEQPMVYGTIPKAKGTPGESRQTTDEAPPKNFFEGIRKTFEKAPEKKPAPVENEGLAKEESSTREPSREKAVGHIARTEEESPQPLQPIPEEETAIYTTPPIPYEETTSVPGSVGAAGITQPVTYTPPPYLTQVTPGTPQPTITENPPFVPVTEESPQPVFEEPSVTLIPPVIPTVVVQTQEVKPTDSVVKGLGKTPQIPEPSQTPFPPTVFAPPVQFAQATVSQTPSETTPTSETPSPISEEPVVTPIPALIPVNKNAASNPKPLPTTEETGFPPSYSQLPVNEAEHSPEVGTPTSVSQINVSTTPTVPSTKLKINDRIRAFFGVKNAPIEEPLTQAKNLAPELSTTETPVAHATILQTTAPETPFSVSEMPVSDEFGASQTTSQPSPINKEKVSLPEELFGGTVAVATPPKTTSTAVKEIRIEPATETVTIPLQSNKDRTAFFNVVKAAKNDPPAFEKIVEENISSAVAKNPPLQASITPAVIGKTAQDFTLRMVDAGKNINTVEDLPKEIASPINPVAYFSAVADARDPGLKNIIPDTEERVKFASAAKTAADVANTQYQTNTALLKTFLPENVVVAAYGPEEATQFKIAENQENQSLPAINISDVHSFGNSVTTITSQVEIGQIEPPSVLPKMSMPANYPGKMSESAKQTSVLLDKVVLPEVKPVVLNVEPSAVAVAVAAPTLTPYVSLSGQPIETSPTSESITSVPLLFTRQAGPTAELPEEKMVIPEQPTISEGAKEKLEEAISRQKDIQEPLTGKKIYARVEISKEAPPPSESTIKFIEEAKNYPASFEKDLAESIKAKITPELSKKLTPEQIDFIVKKTAFDTVSAINNFPAQSSANTQSAILGALAEDSKILPKLVAETNTAELLKKASADLGHFKNSAQLSKNILSSIDENLAVSVFGTGPENLKVSFLGQPNEGYTHEIDLGQLNEGYTNLLESQSDVLDNIGSFASDKAKSLLTGRARDFLDSKIANLPADSAISKFYNSELGQQVLSSAGFSKTTPIGESPLGGLIQKIPGGSNFLEGLGDVLGIDLIGAAAPAEIAEASLLVTEGTALVEEAAVVEGGTLLAEGATGIVAAEGLATGIETEAVTKLLTPVVGKAAASAATKAAVSVVGKGTMVALNTALQTLGSWIPIIGNAIALALGWVVGKIIEKINWKKVKENGMAIGSAIIGAPMLVGGLVIGSTGLILGGITVVGVGVASTAGVTMAGVGSGIAVFFRAVGRTFLTAAVMPILIALLVIPVLVALILFIINSGAYVVPPSTPTGYLAALSNPYISVEKTANPAGPFNNSDIPTKTKITYTITVSAKKGVLTNVSFKDECKVIKTGTPPSCPSPSQGTPAAPVSISPTKPFSFTYTRSFTSHNYDNSATVNTFTVTADTTDQKGVVSAGSASIIIGAPPMECPNNAWPLANDAGINLITQGSMTPLGWTHYNTPNAIDIGVNGATIIAMHSGTISTGESACGGRWVRVASSCGGSSFSSYYGHLGSVMVGNGQRVTIGQPLGISDNTGSCTSGPHLHFQFFDTGPIPTTQKPYLKRNVPLGCTSTATCN